MALSTSTSVLSVRSPSGAFSMINQIQLFILLPTVPDSFPLKLESFIVGVDFTILSFDFLPTSSIPYVNDFKNWVDIPQTDEYFHNIGIVSKSTVLNNISLIATFMIILVVQIIICLIYCWVKKKGKEKVCCRIIHRLFVYFNFNIYIRLTLESFVFITISVVSELSNAEIETVNSKVSFCFWIFLGTLLILFIWEVLLLYCKNPINSGKVWKYQELFEGLKNKKVARLNSFVFISVRLWSILLIVLCSNTHIKIILFILVNVFYWGYLILFRPFEEVKDNITEGINQILFLVLTLPLIFLTKEQEWNIIYVNIYLYMMLMGPWIGSIISFIDLIKTSWK